MADVEVDGTPLPTNSMITVRLSDTQSESEPFPDLEERRQSAQAISVPSTRTSNSTASSRRSSSSSATNSVNWEGLEKTEEQEPRDEGTDESTALLLARLEQENNALAHDPKSKLPSGRPRGDATTRPPSIHHLKKLVNGPQRQSLRYSLLPAPPMTELEFWAALVKDYRQTCQRLPTLTSNKIRSGVPPPLRGVVWPAIAGAHDSFLHSEYQRLSVLPSPFDGIIGKDVGRSFPNVDMFREKDGEGQRMLGRVLKAFSLYDEDIGYCQGLGFVVGPLLIHMSEAEAFAVLARLMEHYDLRNCYTRDLAGLHLRIFQFQALLSRHKPELSAHLLSLKIEPLYISQWFLSFFAVTCPLPMLLRIYDVILSEGATETLMRVALSLMQRNEKKLLGFSEFEDAMQFLLSRGLWDTYAQHADDLVADFVSLTGLVSKESLQSLEREYQQSQALPTTSTLRSAASSLLGRFWAGGAHNTSKSANLSLTIPSNSGFIPLIKTLSGNSSSISTVAPSSAVTTTEGAVSEISTIATDNSDAPRAKSDDLSIISAEAALFSMGNKDRDLHQQIEELLTAMNKLQHQQLELARDLQREREERAEERDIATSLLTQLQKQTKAIKELAGVDEVDDKDKGVNEHEDAGKETSTPEELEIEELISRAIVTFADQSSRRQSIMLSKHQLRDDVAAWKEKHDYQAARCTDLMKQLDQRDHEHNAIKENLREARSRVQDTHRDKQRLEKQLQDLRGMVRSNAAVVANAPISPESPDLYTPVNESSEMRFSLSSSSSNNTPTASTPTVTNSKGLREFRLGRPDSMVQQRSPTTNYFGKRTSSLQQQYPSSSSSYPHAHPSSSTTTSPPMSSAATPSVESGGNSGNANTNTNETILAELVASKTSEALARQELEETKAKLDVLRKIIAGGVGSPGGAGGSGSGSGAGSSGAGSRPRTSDPAAGVASAGDGAATPAAAAAATGGPTSAIGGFFAGWGRRA